MIAQCSPGRQQRDQNSDDPLVFLRQEAQCGKQHRRDDDCEHKNHRPAVRQPDGISDDQQKRKKSCQPERKVKPRFGGL